MEIRETDGKLTIEGYINVTERKSKVMTDSKGKFVETIKQGCFKRALERNNNILLLLNHDFSKKLGDTQTNLELREDDIGLKYKVETDNTELLDLYSKDQLTGTSFGFNNALGYRYQGKILDTREIKDLDLVEVSILGGNHIPAYSGCSVEVRDLENNKLELETRELEDYNNAEIPNFDVMEAEVYILKNKNKNLYE